MEIRGKSGKPLIGFPTAITAADFNNDHHLDLATAQFVTGAFAALGDGSGGFNVQPSLTTNNRPGGVIAADFNGDGNMDLMVIGGLPHNTQGMFLDAFLGTGTGTFTALSPILVGTGSFEGVPTVGDFNEDGHMDVVVAPSLGDSTLQNFKMVLVYYGDGTGNFPMSKSFPTGVEPYAIAVGDFNKDGHLDMAVTNKNDGTISVLLGDGTGNFTPAETLSTTDS